MEIEIMLLQQKLVYYNRTRNKHTIMNREFGRDFWDDMAKQNHPLMGNYRFPCYNEENNKSIRRRPSSNDFVKIEKNCV